MGVNVSALASATVLDTDGGRHLVGEFWRDRSALLVFIRHFG
jgi:hypothetical protein